MAINVAENLLKWIPKNTHQYDKFIKPNEIDDLLKKNNFQFMNKKGLIFDLFALIGSFQIIQVPIIFALTKNTSLFF